MCIKTAVEIALAEGKCIKRKSDGMSRNIIMPTDSKVFCCIVFGTASKSPYPQWIPCGDDLSADDWEVVENRYKPKGWRPCESELSEDEFRRMAGLKG